MKNTDVILLFKGDNGMDNNTIRWKRFCRRYKGRNVDSIVQDCAVRYDINSDTAKRRFKKELVMAINNTLTVH